MNTIIFLAISGIVVLGSGLFKLHKWLLAFSLIACILAFILNLSGWNIQGSYYNHMVTIDPFAIKFTGLLIFETILVFLLCGFYYSNEIEHLADIYSLFIFPSSGA